MTKLNPKEKQILETLLEEIEIKERKTRRSIVVAMVGLIASGKTSVAVELAKQLDATVVNRDRIGTLLRRKKTRQEGTRSIMERLALHIIKQGGNVVLDTDYGDLDKRKGLRAALHKTGARIVYVRTFADRDVVAGRIMFAPISKEDLEFFGEASSPWQGNKLQVARVVKFRELLRRTPRHYRWVDKTGGQWQLKKLPFKYFEIDTTVTKKWKQQIKQIVQKLLA